MIPPHLINQDDEWGRPLLWNSALRPGMAWTPAHASLHTHPHTHKRKGIICCWSSDWPTSAETLELMKPASPLDSPETPPNIRLLCTHTYGLLVIYFQGRSRAFLRSSVWILYKTGYLSGHLRVRLASRTTNEDVVWPQSIHRVRHHSLLPWRKDVCSRWGIDALWADVFIYMHRSP